MDTPSDVYAIGLFDDKYRAFLETVVQLRPRLHRYCSRMTGSIGSAVERLVIHLPPKERACVLLKDGFDYTLIEISDLVGRRKAVSRLSFSVERRFHDLARRSLGRNPDR